MRAVVCMRVGPVVALLASISALAGDGMEGEAALHPCPQTRPQMCIKLYQPVCAKRDTGVRCIKAPCPTMEWRTYANSCDACSDERVQGWQEGECNRSGVGEKSR